MADSNLSEEEELELLQLQKQKAMVQANASSPMAFLQNVGPDIAKQAGEAVLASSPTKLTKKFFEQDPADVQRYGGAALPIAGGMVGGPAGAAAGELARQVTGTAFAPDTVPKTPLGRAASVVTAGVMQEPKILEAIPGVPQVAKMASGMLGKLGKGAARAVETMTGVKARDIAQAAKQGISTYGAPSLEKASQTFGEALGPEGQQAMKVPASEAFDSALTKARSVASDIGTKLENGEAVSSIDALKARQATDRIISATPVTDKATRGTLFGWRSKFDDIIASQNGPLKEASNQYRQAIVKDKILNLTRLNKSGEPSAFLPMLAGHSMAGRGIEGGLGLLTMTSPAAAGLAATVGGSTARGLNSLAQNPAARQVLMQVLQRIMQKKDAAKP